MDVLREYERELGERFLAGLPQGVHLYGPAGMDGRVPTFLLNVEGVPAEAAAHELAARGLGVWYRTTGTASPSPTVSRSSRSGSG